MSTLQKVLGYSTAVANFSELLFVILLAAISLVLSAAVEYILTHLQIRQGDRVELLKHGLIGFFVMAVILAPVLETLLFQQVPILLARRFGMPLLLQFALGTIPFAATHFETGLVSGAAAGIVGGVTLSLAYITFVSQSKMKAFVVTAATHSLHNLVPFAMYARELA